MLDASTGRFGLCFLVGSRTTSDTLVVLPEDSHVGLYVDRLSARRHRARPLIGRRVRHQPHRRGRAGRVKVTLGRALGFGRLGRVFMDDSQALPFILAVPSWGIRPRSPIQAVPRQTFKLFVRFKDRFGLASRHGAGAERDDRELVLHLDAQPADRVGGHVGEVGEGRATRCAGGSDGELFASFALFGVTVGVGIGCRGFEGVLERRDGRTLGEDLRDGHVGPALGRVGGELGLAI